jgi:hypothetical protein
MASRSHFHCLDRRALGTVRFIAPTRSSLSDIAQDRESSYRHQDNWPSARSVAAEKIGAAAARSPNRAQDQKAPETPLGAFHISVDSRTLLGENLPVSPLREQAAALRCTMLRQSSNRRLKDLSHGRILLIDRCQATRELIDQPLSCKQTLVGSEQVEWR